MNKTEIEIEIIRATDELKKLIDLATGFTAEEKAKRQTTSPNRTPEGEIGPCGHPGPVGAPGPATSVPPPYRHGKRHEYTEWDNTSTVRRVDPFDAEEAYDDIPGKDAVRRARAEKLLIGLHEIAGLVNRARAELFSGDLNGCAITLGRIANAIDRELNK